MRRGLPLLAALLAVAVVPAAAANVVSFSITGPGLAEPLAFKAPAEGGSGKTYWLLVEGLGFMPAAFGPSSTFRPAGELGPRYTVRYRLPGGGRQSITQNLYPYADAGPVTHLPSGQRIYGGRTFGGWYLVHPSTKATLVARGLPATSTGAGSSHRSAAAAGIALAGLIGGAGIALIRRRRG